MKTKEKINKETIQYILDEMNFKIKGNFILDKNNKIIKNQYNIPINIDEIIGICDGFIITS